MPQSSPTPGEPDDVTFDGGFATDFAPMGGLSVPRAPIAPDPLATVEGPLVRLADVTLGGEAVPAYATAGPA